MWYGGGKFGQFGDYYDCSYIRIQGGNDVADEYQVTFEAGINTTIASTSGCLAAVDRIGACPYEARGLQCAKAKVQLPKGFKVGDAAPQKVYSAPLVATQARAARPRSGYPGIADLTIWLVYHNRSMATVGLYPRINKHQMPAMTVSATTRGAVDMVEWYVDGIKVSTQRGGPYYLTGMTQSTRRAVPWTNMPGDTPVVIFARACDSATRRCSKKVITPTFFHKVVPSRLGMREVLIERAGAGGTGVLAPIRNSFSPVNLWRHIAVNIRAELVGDVRAVEFWINGKLVTTTFVAPYRAFLPEVGWTGFPINKRFLVKIIATGGGGDTFAWEQDMLFFRFYDRNLVIPKWK